MSSGSRKKGRKAAEKKVEDAVKGAAKEVEKVEKAVTREARALGEPKREKLPMAKPSGHVPVAMVMSRHGTGMISRRAKGFSHGELSGAGIGVGLATLWGARVDARRRSTLDDNVSSLKQWSARRGVGAAARKEATAVEERVKEVAREVEEDVEVVEEEVVRAERAVKKGAKKAVRAAKGKVEKPRPRKKKGKN